MGGPLEGTRVVELASLGPGPHAGMQLSDLGADVVRIVRPDAPERERRGDNHVLRGRTTVVLDLKERRGRDDVLELVRHADVLIEGFRPGVAERLGVGPEQCRAVNAGLVYARVTGWGQFGPLSHRAGHDINYIAVTGVLHAIGTREHPIPPLSLVGNYGGGSMLLVTGVLAALLQRERTGRGDVLDVATVDGACTLMQPVLDLYGLGSWTDQRNDNLLDGGAPFYRTYACADGGHVAVGAIEPQFYGRLVAGLGLDPAGLPDQDDRAGWPALAHAFACAFARHPREHWVEVFAEVDACVTPVLSIDEASRDPHIRARGTLSAGPGPVVAAPAPRFADSGWPEGSARTSRAASVSSVIATWQPRSDASPRLPEAGEQGEREAH